MSRIDEVLKRASGAAPSLPEAARRTARAEEWALEHYPGEAGTPVDAGPSRPHVPLAPVASAPLEAPVPAGTQTPAPPRLAPSTTTIRSRGRTAIKPDPKLVVSREVPPVCVEQYRRLVASLHDLQVERGLKAVVLTSALPEDGKTLTAVNLALTLSESYGRRVLLIDADLRRPSIHEKLGLQNAAGLNEALSSATRELPVTEVSPLLSLMFAGRPNPNPLAGLSSDRMRQILDDCVERYDWVLLDAPPVGLLPDAQLLARLTEAVIFVIRAGSTPFSLVEKAISEIGRDAIVGTVLNAVDDESIPATSYYQQYINDGA